MKIAVTYADGQVYQHFGHAAQFKLYTIESGMILDTAVVDATASGHSAMVSYLQRQGVNTVICGGIGGGAVSALAGAGIRLFAGATGSADPREQTVDDADVRAVGGNDTVSGRGSRRRGRWQRRLEQRRFEQRRVSSTGSEHR